MKHWFTGANTWQTLSRIGAVIVGLASIVGVAFPIYQHFASPNVAAPATTVLLTEGTIRALIPELEQRLVESLSKTLSGTEAPAEETPEEPSADDSAPDERLPLSRVVKILDQSESSTTYKEDSLLFRLQAYSEYLARIGLDPATTPPLDIVIDPSAPFSTAVYHPGENRIVLPKASTNLDIIFREYTHHVLLTQLPPSLINSIPFRTLESALAWYFPSSFQNDPAYPESFPSHSLRSYAFNLENTQKVCAFGAWPTGTFSSNPTGNGYIYRAHEPWGGAFWEIRKTLGDRKADRLLLAAWTTLGPGDPERDSFELFTDSIINELERSDGDSLAAKVDMILESRTTGC